MIQILYQGEIFADYHQVYMRDELHPELPDDYTDENIKRRIMVRPTAIILHTERNMMVPVRVEWHSQRPAFEKDVYQHVVEASIFCQSGQLVLAGMTDNEEDSPRLRVKAGPIGVRANLYGLDTLSDDGLDGNDRYLLQLWPESEPQGVNVLQAW